MDEELCTCCGKKPVAGYIGYGVKLDTLCLKCWKKGDQPAEGHNRKNTFGTTGKPGRS